MKQLSSTSRIGRGADKYVLCFTKEHGKIRFIAYGARYEKKMFREDYCDPLPV